MSDLKVGDKIKFSYLKEKEFEYGSGGVSLVDYSVNVGTYVGTIDSIRDITESKLSRATLQYGKIKGERSKYLYTLLLDDASDTSEAYQCFYGGRMINPQPVVEEQDATTVSKNVIKEELKRFTEKLVKQLDGESVADETVSESQDLQAV
jgi:hypothetical protein